MEGLPRDLTGALELYAGSPDPLHLRMLFEALEGAQILLPLVARDRRRLLPLFGDAVSLVSWAGGGTRYLALQGLDVVHLALRGGYDALLLDPGTDREAEIGREALEALAAGLPEAPYADRPDICP